MFMLSNTSRCLINIRGICLINIRQKLKLLNRVLDFNSVYKIMRSSFRPGYLSISKTRGKKLAIIILLELNSSTKSRKSCLRRGISISMKQYVKNWSLKVNKAENGFIEVTPEDAVKDSMLSSRANASPFAWIIGPLTRSLRSRTAAIHARRRCSISLYVAFLNRFRSAGPRSLLCYDKINTLAFQNLNFISFKNHV